ncbi:type 2 periplasmic-binding domain-containing protein [Sessilibacter sp. MAH2]
MRIGTLGPQDTNSEMASYFYLKENNFEGDVALYDTPELSIEALKNEEVDKVILCIVYPKLNDIVFQNLTSIKMTGVFMKPTDAMVIGVARDGDRACSHPAPVELIQPFYSNVELVNSNADAAKQCALGNYDACVTTLAAAKTNNLEVKHSYGPVSMGWAIFERRH